MDVIAIEPTDEPFQIALIENPSVTPGRTAAILVWNETNDFVVVGIDNQVVGGITGEHQAAWADFTSRLEQEDLVAQVDALVRFERGELQVWLFADPEAEYLTPGEEADDAADSSGAVEFSLFVDDDGVAGASGVRSERWEAGHTRARARAERLLNRSEGRCRDCGNHIEPTGKRGRPPVRCASCRAGAPVPSTVRAAAPEWVRSPSPSDWSVLDLETTGLWPSVDRVIEIAVVRLNARGEKVASWTTLVDPDRDIGAGDIHGLSAFHLRGAPRFADLAPSILALLADTRIAAHNSFFDTDFLTAEFARVGIDWGAPDSLCTMRSVSQYRLAQSRDLATCCAELGIPLIDAHCAIADAEATAGLVTRILPRLDFAVACVPHLSDGPLPPPSRTRTDPPPPRIDSSLGALADRVGVPEDLDVSPDAASAYLALLDRVLEDRKITDHEIAGLADVAARWGISAANVRALHRAYLGGVWELAKADGVITAAEERDLKILSELLGVDLDGDTAPVTPMVSGAEDLRGKTVCFTGGSVVSISGDFLTREIQETLAAEYGMVVKSSVSKKLDILVLADPDSRSGKSKTADDLGVRKIAEPVFWRMLGVGID